MGDTPRSSSTPSRSGTPLPRSPSRLVIPRHTPSVPTLQPNDSTSPHMQPATGLESSASSVINLDISDGILVHDVDAEVDTTTSEETTAVGLIDDIADEESRKSLRDQLRRTLSKKEHTGLSVLYRMYPHLNMSQISTRGNLWLLSSTRSQPPSVCHSNLSSTFYPDICAISRCSAWTIQTKRVFCSDRRRKACLHWVRRPLPTYEAVANGSFQCTLSGSGNEDELSSTMAIIQALVSVFIDDGDKLRCINAGPLTITFLLRSPIYYVCASTWGEPESVVRTMPRFCGVLVSDRADQSKTRSHLEYLHLQILSIVTASQLRRIFERRTNFDLRRLLNGSSLLSYCIKLNADSLSQARNHSYSPYLGG